MQDKAEFLARERKQDAKSAGLMLEPSHNLHPENATVKLPEANLLKGKDIIVYVEVRPGEKISVEELHVTPPDIHIKKYLQGLAKAGPNVEIIGLNSEYRFFTFRSLQKK